MHIGFIHHAVCEGTKASNKLNMRTSLVRNKNVRRPVHEVRCSFITAEPHQHNVTSASEEGEEGGAHVVLLGGLVSQPHDHAQYCKDRHGRCKAAKCLPLQQQQPTRLHRTSARAELDTRR